MGKQRFHTRSFISFLLFFTIIWLLVTGTALYIAPPGRVAHWQHWIFLGFDKDQWQAQHTIFSYLFIIISIIHIFSLNWKNLWSYVRLKSRTGFRKKKEFGVAVSFSLLVLLGTSFEIPPMSSFFEFGEYIGSTWEEKELKAPVPHTENLTLFEISSNFEELNVADIIQILNQKGIEVSSKDQTLKQIAIQNNMPPSNLYKLISPSSKSENGMGRGYGKMTIKELSNELSMSVEDILYLLSKNNIDAAADDNIKDIAMENDLHPSQIMKMIRE